MDKLILALINSREFQRLRRIRQLGFSEFVYPGANHNRLSHSIGVMYCARLFLKALRENGARIEPEHAELVMLAALLHDVGHGPFSHAFEKITNTDHEKWTETILRDPSTEVHKLLAERDPLLPAQISSFINRDEGGTTDFPVALTHIVSSQLDADRMDYLLRDSQMTGTRHGLIDYSWLVRTLVIHPSGEYIYVNRKGHEAVEGYIMARYHMFKSVYFHKTTRGAEVMLRQLLERIRSKLEEAGVELQDLIPGAPDVIEPALRGRIELADYLALDETTLWELIRRAARAQDQVIRFFAEGLLYRQLMKAVQMPDDPDSYERIAQFRDAAGHAIEAAGFDPAWCLVEDTTSDNPYKVYDPNTDKRVTNVYVEDGNRRIRPLQDVCPPVRALQRYHKIRYYVPATVRDKVLELSDGILYNR